MEFQCGISLTAGKSKIMKQKIYMEMKMADFKASLAPSK
jgi:hypothetical protein